MTVSRRIPEQGRAQIAEATHPARPRSRYICGNATGGTAHRCPARCRLAASPGIRGYMQVIAVTELGAVGMGLAIEATLRLFPSSEFPNLLESIPFAGESFEQGFEFGVRVLARGLLAVRQNNPK